MEGCHVIQRVRFVDDVLFRLGIDLEQVFSCLWRSDMEDSLLSVFTFQVAHDILIEFVTLRLNEKSMTCIINQIPNDIDKYLILHIKLEFVSDHLQCFDLDINRFISNDWHWQVIAE